MDYNHVMAKREKHKGLDVFEFPHYPSWLAWLDKNHIQQESVWVKLAKKKSGIASISYEEGREGAIIYGWIDGLINGYDDQYYLIKFSPRRPRSNWSKINRGIAEQLIAEKRMKPAGVRQVDLAKEDGRWDTAYDSPATIQVPEELTRLLATDPTARQNFDSLNSTNRYAFLYRIQNAKRAETKQRHIESAFQMLRNGEVYHPNAGRKKKNAKKPDDDPKKKPVPKAARKKK